MAKKRKASGRNTQPGGPKELDATDARLGAITTFEDVADSEDEFFMERDQILLEDEHGSKRRRKAEEDMEMSDEEVLGYEDDDSDDDDGQPQKSKAPKGALSDEEVEEGEEGDSGWWGSSKKEYYNADNIETEADALEEEAEAKRMQQKKLSKMAEEDFIFDGDEWLADGAGAGEDEETVTEVLKDIEVTDDMGPEERYTLLQTRYPEFDHLVREFETLQHVLVDVKNAAQGKSGKSLEAIKYWVLGCYVAALASYFAILTSPARDSSKTQKTLDPTELRDHDVMQTLMSCREAWQKLKHSKSAKAVNEDQSSELDEEEIAQLALAETVVKPKKSKTSKQVKAAAEKKARAFERFKAGEAAVADLYDLPMAGAKSKKQKKSSRAETNDDNSDFGEEDELDARTAADKAARKKSLKFYTSQIVQKSNRRADAGRDAGGDMDLPHRERLRDRQARLNAQAERRGKDNKLGADLGDNSDEEDATTAKAVRDDENEYYDMVAHKSKKNKDEKAARYAAYAAASKSDRVVENEVIGEDGKRKITYAIEKNKGLTPKRGKDVRNPRVKKRKQYEAKQKKLKSMKPVWQGGEPKGGYQGELSGINTAVIKSTRL
ncbi:Sas10 C-terminal domain-containing protein [Dactylonectria macrodidyma]|uniref:Sas10 C-terminal domain-containing protein n=1 Tax=Dactylonectria macrodidyma TaxID=307937 RepID=A0A9P9EU10_9HYPO|nr:Sas10 C-terminal domain-containing protein [Dactylonectria macrodidyma]